MDEIQKIEAAFERVEALRKEAGASCLECRWAQGPEPGYSTLGFGLWCRSPVAVLQEARNSNENGLVIPGAIPTKQARGRDGLCGASAKLWEPKLVFAFRKWFWGLF
jgi:hypothetical protein